MHIAGSSSARGWRSGAVVVALALCVWVAVRGVAGITGRDVATAVGTVGVTHLLWLAAVWIGGLVVYSAVVLPPALPGLTARRGLLLNLTGSAVANSVPLGGAAATALNWRMARRWGHSDGAFVGYCLTTNLLDVVSKLALPLVAVTVLATSAAPVPVVGWWTAAGCASALLALGVLDTLLLRASAPCATSGRAVGRWQAWLHRARRSGSQTRELLRRGWYRLVPGSVVYLLSQVLLFSACLYSVGLRPSIGVCVMSAAMERLGTLVPVTPGGVGFAEAGAVAWLIGSGMDPVQAVAGVVVYRSFIFALEIPVGGALLGLWVLRQRLVPRADGDPAS